MQLTLSRSFTHVADSISNEDNRYDKSSFIWVISMEEMIFVFEKLLYII